MALSATEKMSAGFVRDDDGRLIVVGPGGNETLDDSVVPTTANFEGSLLYLWDATNSAWKRARQAPTIGNALDLAQGGVLATVPMVEDTTGGNVRAARSGGADGGDGTRNLGVVPFGYNGTALERFRTALASSASWPSAGIQAVQLGAYTGSSLGRVDHASAQGEGSAGNTMLAAPGYLYNGSNWDRERGTIEASLIAAGARTASVNSVDAVNYSGRGIAVTLDITAASGTGGLTVRILVKLPGTSNYAFLNTAPTAVTATGQYIYVLYPGASAAGAAAQATPLPLPRTFRVTVTHGDASSYTYSVGYSIIV